MTRSVRVSRSLCATRSLFESRALYARLGSDSIYARDSLFTQTSRLLPSASKTQFFFLRTHLHHVANLIEMGAVEINHLKFRFQSLLNLHVISC